MELWLTMAPICISKPCHMDRVLPRAAGSARAPLVALGELRAFQCISVCSLNQGLRKGGLTDVLVLGLVSAPHLKQSLSPSSAAEEGAVPWDSDGQVGVLTPLVPTDCFLGWKKAVWADCPSLQPTKRQHVV